jgi:hypothetical protein
VGEGEIHTEGNNYHSIWLPLCFWKCVIEGFMDHNPQTSQRLWGARKLPRKSTLWCVLSIFWLLQIQFRVDWELPQPNFREENKQKLNKISNLQLLSNPSPFWTHSNFTQIFIVVNVGRVRLGGRRKDGFSLTLYHCMAFEKSLPICGTLPTLKHLDSFLLIKECMSACMFSVFIGVCICMID